MGVNFTVAYHELVFKEDIPKLSSVDKKRTKKAIESKLTTEPEIFGKPLRRSLKGYMKLRVGDYRIVFRIEKDIVKIFYIGHRSIAYKKVIKRIEG
jgi:mRNA interferase RelE/StbE